MILGILIVVAGVVVLLKNLGLIEMPASLWSLFYPLAIVVIGIYVIIAAKKGKEYGGWIVKKFSKHEKEDKEV